jgi:hypothetical protein
LIYSWRKCTVFKSEEAPNELRIDAAEGDKVRRMRVSAAASIRVERSRTLGDKNLLEIKAQVYAGKIQPSPQSTK